MTAFLQRGNISIGHEVLGPDGMSSWYAAPGGRIQRGAHPRNPALRRMRKHFGTAPITILHQVRHPLKTISTFQRASKQTWRFIRSVCPRVSVENSTLLNCMFYWVDWNKMAEELAEWTYQIERLPEVFDEFFDRINCDRCKDPEMKDHMLATSKRVNSRRSMYKPRNWNDLFNENTRAAIEVVELGIKYGYDLEDEVRYALDSG